MIGALYCTESGGVTHTLADRISRSILATMRARPAPRANQRSHFTNLCVVEKKGGEVQPLRPIVHHHLRYSCTVVLHGSRVMR